MVYKFETTKERSELMQKIKSIDTKPEIQFRKSLWAKGIRYRKNNRELPGNPDICISKQKITIFIDGEFWHGFDWENKKLWEREIKKKPTECLERVLALVNSESKDNENI